MAKKKIGAYITLDGEKKFKSAVTDCNKSISTMRSEMKLVEAQTAGNANTLDTLKKKNEVLTRIVEEHSKKEEALKSGLSNAERAYSKVGSELEQYKQKLSQAQYALEEMKSSQEASEAELTEQESAVQNLAKIVEKGEETYRKAGNRVQDWQKQLNNAEAQTIKVTRALNENAAYMRERIFGTTQDGIVSNQFACYRNSNPGLDSGFEWEANPTGYSPLIRAMQAWCGAKQDGHIGPATISAIQRKLGCAADGCFSGPSPAIKALQRWINQQ